MKALISAFALLSFVGAATIPYVAQAQTEQTAPKKHHKSHKTASHKHHKKTAAAG